MNIVDVLATDLKPAPYNPREIPQHQFESLQRSIDEFGFVEPVIVNKTTGYIVGGHMRVQAAKALGVEKVPVVYVELDDQKERALNVALNKVTGDFDTDKLAELLSDLDDESLLLTGFTEEELETLQDGWVDHEELEEPKPSKPTVKKYTIDDLRTAFRYYPFNEHKDILRAAVDWLAEREVN